MRFISSKRGLVVLVAVFLLGLLIAAGALLFDRFNRTEQVTQATPEQIFEDAINKVETENSAKRDSLLNSIKTIDEFKALSEDDQGFIGTLLAGQNLEQGKVEYANQLLDYLMTKNNSDSVSASQMCYRAALTDERRTFCRDKAFEILKAQDMLEDGQIPAGFLEPLEEQG